MAEAVSPQSVGCIQDVRAKQGGRNWLLLPMTAFTARPKPVQPHWHHEMQWYLGTDRKVKSFSSTSLLIVFLPASVFFWGVVM